MYAGAEADQKAFIKVFDSLTGRFNRWQIWRDMVEMIACAIANTVDLRHYDAREQMYMNAIKKYEPDELRRFKEMFSILVESMDQRVERGV